MGKQVPGKKINRKFIIRFANEQQRIAQRNQKAVQNAVIANANMQQVVQHEICLCTHGGTKHLTPERLCTMNGCTCTGFTSLWENAFRNWQSQFKLELLKIGIPNVEEGVNYPPEVEEALNATDFPAWFDSNVKPDQAALRIKEKLEVPKDEPAPVAVDPSEAPAP